MAERLRAVGLEAEDLERIRGIRGVLEGFAAGADEFIRHLSANERTRHIMQQPHVVEEIRTLKQAHITAMAQGDYGIGYAAERIELAMLYSSIGLDVKWFLGAFHHLTRAAGLEIQRALKDEPERAFQSFLSFKKIAFFDIGLMVDALIFERERTIRAQQEAIRELSTPVLQVRPGLLILPLIGIVDSPRAMQLTEQLLRAIRANRSKVVVLDITGVAGLDSRVANHLIQTVEAARLMGAETILSGVAPEVAQTVVTIGVDLSRVRTVGDLQRGIEEAERILGYRLVAAEETNGLAPRS